MILEKWNKEIFSLPEFQLLDWLKISQTKSFSDERTIDKCVRFSKGFEALSSLRESTHFQQGMNESPVLTSMKMEKISQNKDQEFSSLKTYLS